LVAGVSFRRLSFVSPTKLELPRKLDPMGLEALIAEAEVLGGGEAAGGVSPQGSSSEVSAELPKEALTMVRAEVAKQVAGAIRAELAGQAAERAGLQQNVEYLLIENQRLQRLGVANVALVKELKVLKHDLVEELDGPRAAGIRALREDVL